MEIVEMISPPPVLTAQTGVQGETSPAAMDDVPSRVDHGLAWLAARRVGRRENATDSVALVRQMRDEGY